MISEIERLTKYTDGRRAFSRLDALDPRCRLLCALSAALVISSLQEIPALAAAGVLPVLLLFADGRDGFFRTGRTLLGINGVSILVCLFLPLTYPGTRVFGVFSIEGARMAMLVTWKLNLISICMTRLAVSMGMPGIDGALTALRVPLKMRMLILLTTRYVFLLSERVLTMTRAVRLRAPKCALTASYRAMGCMIGTTLIHCSDRAERACLALRLRGGVNGFSGHAQSRWAARDSLMCLCLFIYFAFVLVID
ncbi:hypothetical protein FACS1894216_15790 [Synergistales bacterium]|nr:hypothetical protein FACS1894216_15790 [Synergistales bacterium]